jgi:hypothetical protein
MMAPAIPPITPPIIREVLTLYPDEPELFPGPTGRDDDGAAS